MFGEDKHTIIYSTATEICNLHCSRDESQLYGKAYRMHVALTEERRH